MRKFDENFSKSTKDHATWTRAEEYSVARPSWKIDESNPGSDLAGEAAAALAAASIVRVFNYQMVFFVDFFDEISVSNRQYIVNYNFEKYFEFWC